MAKLGAWRKVLAKAPAEGIGERRLALRTQRLPPCKTMRSCAHDVQNLPAPKAHRSAETASGLWPRAAGAVSRARAGPGRGQGRLERSSRATPPARRSRPPSQTCHPGVPAEARARGCPSVPAASPQAAAPQMLAKRRAGVPPGNRRAVPSQPASGTDELGLSWAVRTLNRFLAARRAARSPPSCALAARLREAEQSERTQFSDQLETLCFRF